MSEYGSYDWDLPSFTDDSWSNTDSWSASQSDSGNVAQSDYTFSDVPASGSDYMGTSGITSITDDEWYVDSSAEDGTKVDTSMFDDLWGWVKSPQGTSVLGGALNNGMKLWQMEQLAKQRESAQNHDALEIAKMREARIARHNASINAPMNLGLTKFKR